MSFKIENGLEIEDEKYKIGKLDSGVDEIPEVILDMDSEEPSLLTKDQRLTEF